MRSRRRTAALVVAACLVLAASVGGQTPDTPPSPSFSNAEIAKAIETVRADPNLGGKRTIRTLQWRDSGPPRRWTWPSWLEWVRDLIGFIAQSGRALLWIAIIGLALFLAAYLIRVMSGGRAGEGGGRFVMPTHVRDLDIRPESLPPDIGAAARQLWDRGEHRAALALLYRGLLSRLAHVHEVPIRDSTTEGDCLSLAALHLDETRRAYVSQLVRTWQRAVYGGTEPDTATVHALCDAFGRTLDRTDVAGPRSLAVAEASA